MAKTYQVIDVDSGASFGPFKSLALAEACVKRARIKDWEIWNATDTCISWRTACLDSKRPGQRDGRVSGGGPNAQQLPR